MKYIVLYNYDHCEMGGHGWSFFNEFFEISNFISELPDEVKSEENINKYVKVFKISEELKIKPVSVITKFELE